MVVLVQSRLFLCRSSAGFLFDFGRVHVRVQLHVHIEDLRTLPLFHTAPCRPLRSRQAAASVESLRTSLSDAAKEREGALKHQLEEALSTVSELKKAEVGIMGDPCGMRAGCVGGMRRGIAIVAGER